MPKNPPFLPHLYPTGDPADRVQVQDTAFTVDVLGRYACNEWAEIEAQAADGGFPFDAVVIGAGMFGGYCAEKIYRHGTGANLRVLVIEAGPFLFPTHVQNLPQRLGGSVPVWGLPWLSNVGFPGLAYCIGGRSLFWGGWSPRLTDADLARWPKELADWLTTPGPDGRSPYALTEEEVGVAAEAQYILQHTFHDKMKAGLQAAAPAVNGVTLVDEAPLAVVAGSPGPGLFPYDKFSSADFLVDAVRADAGTAGSDVNRRIFVVPRTHVTRLNLTGGLVSSIDVLSNGVPKSLGIPPSCAVVLAAGTIESTRLALDSLGVGSTRFGSPRAGNLMAHLRSNITVRIKRAALGLGGPPQDLETTAFLVRGTSQGRQYHFQVIAAAVGDGNAEKNMWEQVPDVELQDTIRANQDPQWISVVFRCVGEMEGQQSLDPDPARSWIDLSAQTDEFGRRRAYVNLAQDATDDQVWTDMDTAAFGLAAKLAGDPANIQYLAPGPRWLDAAPAVTKDNWVNWRDGLGTTHHEAGTLFAGAPGASLVDTVGRFHNVANCYVAGPAVFPSLGSANPSLTALTLARRTAEAIVSAAVAPPPGPGFAPLSLDPADWTPVVQPGTPAQMLRFNQVLETYNGYGLYFYTKEQFGDFALWLEWREQHTGDNSGVFIRTPGPRSANPLPDAVANGHEIQIDDLGAGTPPGQGIHKTGAIYALQAPLSVPVKPLGEWNTYLIEAKGTTINVTLNGTKVIDSYTSDRSKQGFLALQMHDWPTRVQFRNLQVKKL